MKLRLPRYFKHMNIRYVARQAGLWLAVLTVPVVINMCIWIAVISPQRAEYHRWRDMRTLTTLKPQFEATMATSRQLLQAWQSTMYNADNPAQVMEDIQRLAAQHRVHATTVDVRTHRGLGSATLSRKRAADGTAVYATMPLTVELSGGYGHIAHWIEAVESHAGLQIDSWELSTESELDKTHQFVVELTAYLDET